MRAELPLNREVAGTVPEQHIKDARAADRRYREVGFSVLVEIPRSDPKEVETFQWRQEQWGIFIQRIQDRPMLGYGSDVDESLKDLDRARTASR